ncbi:MAG: glycerol dehydratase reactivase beta/small subunit family protein [Arachnia sp.]
MAKPEVLPRPSVQVAVNEAVPQHHLTELLLGLEEEGIPSTVVRHAAKDPLELAHSASLSSVLGVGVGVSLGYVVVTTEKLSAARPYLARFLGQNAAADRAIGTNAARLVKRVPLVPLAPALAHTTGRTA